MKTREQLAVGDAFARAELAPVTVGRVERQAGRFDAQFWTAGRLTVEQVSEAEETLAQALRVPRVTVDRVAAGEGLLRVFTGAEFPGVVPWRIPPAGGQRGKFRSETVGVDELGGPLEIEVGRRHLLVAGVTGSGKSTLCRAFRAANACREHTVLVGIDPKRVELAAWADRFDEVAVDPDDIRNLLERLLEEMDARETWMAARGVKEITRGTTECPMLVVDVDELASVMADKEMRAMMILLGQRARAAGIMLVCATQTPKDTVIPTELRNNLGWRWCGRTEGRHQTGTILGESWAAKAPAHLIEVNSGEGYIQVEGSGNVRLTKGAFLDDAGERAVVEHTMPLRVGYRVGLGPDQLGPALEVVEAVEPAPVVEIVEPDAELVDPVDVAAVVDHCDRHAGSSGRFPWPGHPLADGRGRVYAHRVVAYAVAGGGTVECAECTRPVFWLSDRRRSKTPPIPCEARVEPTGGRSVWDSATLVVCCPECLPVVRRRG